MLLSKLLLLPVALASTVTVHVQSVPASDDTKAAPIPAAEPLAQIELDADASTGRLASYTPPKGSYSSDHLLRIGLGNSDSHSWSSVLTSADSFTDQYQKKFTLHVDEKGEPFHIGFGARLRGAGDEVEVEVVKRAVGPKPVLNKPIVLNADGKLDKKEPEKTLLQKYWWAIALFVLVQIAAGGGGGEGK